MGILQDDVVVLRRSENDDEPSVITVNCPDKLGLACDITRILHYFRLHITRVDAQTDGKWCYVVYWVIGSQTTRWNSVVRSLTDVCPSCTSASEISFFKEELLQPAKSADVFLLKICSRDRTGLLHDVTKVLSKLELNIKRVKVSTTPDGGVMDLFFITDTRELLDTEKRKEAVLERLESFLGEDSCRCEIEKVGPEITACSQAAPSFLPPQITQEASLTTADSIGVQENYLSGLIMNRTPSISIDNSLSPSHTLVQIICEDHKGLLYDIMRTFKDYNIQIAYGRGCRKAKRKFEIDLFITQADGKKIVDSNKQMAFCSSLKRELSRPLRVAVVSRGPDTELLVANPVELLSGNGRPLVFYDITLALKKLDICIFSAEVGRHMIGHREWEVYKVLLHEVDCLNVSRDRIENEVWKKLMGWDDVLLD